MDPSFAEEIWLCRKKAAAKPESRSIVTDVPVSSKELHCLPLSLESSAYNKISRDAFDRFARHRLKNEDKEPRPASLVRDREHPQ